MKDIKKNRFLIWLMWLIPIACTGWFSVWLWTFAQIFLYKKEQNECQRLQKPIKEREEFIEMNKKENLSEHDQHVLAANKKLIKVGDGVFLYEDK